MFLELLRTADLPLPSTNVWVEIAEVDCFWPEHEVVVELDGGEFHRTPAARDRDNRRDARLQSLGYKVVRFSDRRLVHDPRGVVADVKALLGV